MKVKTADLIGPALDWAVAKCEGSITELAFDGVTYGFDLNGKTKVLAKGWAPSMSWHPSTNWSQSGPIIEREGIEINVRNWSPSPGCRLPGKYEWSARLCFVRQTECKQFGPTPLIAAMRCFVASRLGYEVDVPDELV